MPSIPQTDCERKNPASSARRDRARPPSADPFGNVTRHLNEAVEFAGHYAQARLDGLLNAARKAAIWGGLGALGATVLVAACVASLVFLLMGMANGLGVLLGGHYWAGQLIVGVLGLGGIALGLLLVIRRIQANFRRKVIDRYEIRKLRQRRKFGRDVGTIASHDGRSRVPESPVA